MPRQCPKCKSYTLDYNSEYNVWKCLWVTCDYQEDRTEDQKRPFLISMLGSQPSHNN